jgi:acetyl-CoA acetyltransferase
VLAEFRDRTAIVGVGTTDFGARYRATDPELSAYELAVEAFQNALDDAGLRKDEIDGLVTMRVPSYARMGDILGIRRPRWINWLEGSGRQSGVSIEIAAMAVATGLANVVACVYGNNGRSAGARYGGAIDPNSPGIYDTMYGMTSPGAYVSMMYRRYQHLYGAPDDALAPLAINNRKNGARNSIAVMQKPITYDEYMAARFIAEPLRLFDYCLINDGAVVVIVTSDERARDLRKPPVYITGTTQSADITNFYTSDDFFYASCKDAADRLYRETGLGPNDMDCVQIYDNFTPTILFSLEGFGYCGRGEAWEWVKDGRIELGGQKPINTSGGHTAESYMQGWGMHVEAVRQLRGECGARQVPNCARVQYICASPIVTSHILST